MPRPVDKSLRLARRMFEDFGPESLNMAREQAEFSKLPLVRARWDRIIRVLERLVGA